MTSSKHFLVASTRDLGHVGNTKWFNRQAATSLPSGIPPDMGAVSLRWLPGVVDKRQIVGTIFDLSLSMKPMNHRLSLFLFLFASFVCTVASSQVVHLACQGVTSRNEGGGKHTTSPVVVQVVADPIRKSIRIDGFSCWAGRGNCTLLSVTFDEDRISAVGDGRLANTGFSTVIGIDRRSGYMAFSQGADIGSRIAIGSGPQSEKAELVCQGGALRRF